MAVDASSLTEPTPLRRAAVIHFQWGPQKFEVWCIACSIHTLTWIETGELVTWVHCKGLPKQEIAQGEVVKLMPVLIPAHYVTGIEIGPAFTHLSFHRSEAIGLFPPNQPTPEHHVSLREIVRIIADLLDPSLN